MIKFLLDIWERLWHLHRSDDDTAAATVSEFFVPKLKRGFFLRMGIVALSAFVICKWLLIPCVIDGENDVTLVVLVVAACLGANFKLKAYGGDAFSI